MLKLTNWHTIHVDTSLQWHKGAASYLWKRTPPVYSWSLQGSGFSNHEGYPCRLEFYNSEIYILNSFV